MDEATAYRLCEENKALYDRLRWCLWADRRRPEVQRARRVIVRVSDRMSRRVKRWVEACDAHHHD